VLVIVFENKNYGDVMGRAPYFTSLARHCGLATGYQAITHPSLPNYIAMTSGTTGGITRDCGPLECPVRRPSVFTQTAAAGREWRSYQESMPTPCRLSDSRPYAVRHNPAAYYFGGGAREQCRRWDVRLGTADDGPLAHALSGHQKAYSFVTPNLCNDMHDCSVATGDAWLARWMPRIVRSPAYVEGRLAVFITFDEGRTVNHVPLVVASAYGAPGTVRTKGFNHYSLLRAAEYLDGVRYLGGARDRAIAGLANAFNLYRR
jgi:hypothetical protein